MESSGSGEDFQKAVQDQLAKWGSSLEGASEDVCKGVAKMAIGGMNSADSLEETAKLAIGAISSADSLDEVDEELLKRRKSLRASENGGESQS